MPEINLSDKLNKKIATFVNELKTVYGETLVSVTLYGSGASAEFVTNHSNLNFLIVLSNFNPVVLKGAGKIINRYPWFEVLCLTENYINSSLDIFPIEFLDLQENYRVIYGKDVLKHIHIDIKNLRFQCEQELRIKLIALRQLYFKSYSNRKLLLYTLLKTFTSTLHVLRNVLRLVGKTPPYKKDLIIHELSRILSINVSVWQRLLAIKNKQESIRNTDIDYLFIQFIEELEKWVEFVDKL